MFKNEDNGKESKESDYNDDKRTAGRRAGRADW
jgi:hypothetical protein